METNPEYSAPCGLYCGVCAVLYATLDNNPKFKERLVGVYRGNSPQAKTYPLSTYTAKAVYPLNLLSFAADRLSETAPHKRGIQVVTNVRAFRAPLSRSFLLPLARG